MDLDRLAELEKLVDKLLEEHKKAKEENEQLWKQINEALSKIEKLDKEKRELETLVETYRNSMNSLIQKLQNMINVTESVYEEKREY
ncbi:MULTISPECIES: hypothetical protein [Pseudothermotoga]|jgi:archaellum component FlaC|uniref:Uncharacterized protein n=1 Tax=Pseudothermotoga lettingae (strain ATCC BAA-301 / DSM 14385 / NBRC 107922 / TMO) TaxID=416591 RepID=A8F4K9_PSELT|nr:conserved hypothetical protein [Pseudothermotoga lettingae TMO]MDI3494310.1 hypothetical protein [Pseudothermotoga sp.]MDK2884099.1 hypothetical protein [Pseudothermotoga sp.]